MVSRHSPMDNYLPPPPPRAIAPDKILPGQLPLNSCPSDNYPPGKCPLWNSLRKLPPKLLLLGQLLLNSFPRDSYHLKISQRIVAPWTFALEHFSLNNFSLNNHPLTNDLPWNSPRNKWQWTFALENDVSIINRCRSAKVLFTHFGLEILNKFWKINRQGAVHATSRIYFTLRKSLL